jgi:RimJ/RimL family protein N-acetyltransferase
VAVTVADEIQGRGAGNLLMRLLAAAGLERGITRFSASVLPSNEASYRLLASVGTVVDDQVETGCRDITVRLAPETTTRSADDWLDA